MNNQDRQNINKNLSNLIERTQFDSSLKNKLLEKNVFNSSMLERIGGSGLDSCSVNRKLYVDVQTRGPHAFKNLLEALIESGNVSAAQVLDPNIPDQDRSSEKNNKVWNTPSYNAQESKHHSAAPSPPVWQNNTTPLDVKVIKTGVIRMGDHPAIKTYKMESKPRGLVLIIDNENFDNEVLPTRTGSLVDSNNLDVLFLQMGFHVTMRRNLGYTDMIMEIQKFAGRPDHDHVDMCVLCIMSHGRHGLVAAADGRELETEWVLRQFNNEGCPSLIGKPKFFILQSCRGDEADYGVVPKINFPESRSDSDARAISLPPGSKSSDTRYRGVTWEDMIVAYSTLPGYVANRDTYRGTWFIECLCKVFMENAHQLEIREMLDIVAEKLKQFESEHGTKQSCAYEVRNFYKKLYFNP